jgi:hypothetical protein
LWRLSTPSIAWYTLKEGLLTVGDGADYQELAVITEENKSWKW